jgi:prepilin-type N-terminal cleavage/methylation domain-containing protein
MRPMRESGRSGGKIQGGGGSAIEAKGAAIRGTVRAALRSGCENFDGGGRRLAGGFTLVELLVVIAIIALLMSILMPALSRAREQAKDVLCQSNLRQWCTVHTMYAEDHEGYVVGYNAGSAEHWWPLALLPYYGQQDLCLCPAAIKFWSEGNPPSSISAWGIWTPENSEWLADDMMPGYEGLYGSYGANEFSGNVNDDVGEGYGGAEKFWRRLSVKGAGYVPLLLDCDMMGGFPEHTDEPPPYDGCFDMGGGGFGELLRFCLNRHRMAINGLFLDCSVRRIDLKELWTLKWHRNFATNGPWTKVGGAEVGDWPDWMRGARDY